MKNCTVGLLFPDGRGKLFKIIVPCHLYIFMASRFTQLHPVGALKNLLLRFYSVHPPRSFNVNIPTLINTIPSVLVLRKLHLSTPLHLI